MPYLSAIHIAIMSFPIVAFILALPLMLRYYIKFGRVAKWRLFVTYTFSFYLVCAYFLTILPLPTIESVSQMTGSTYNFRPFMFIIDFINYSGFSPEQPSTWLQALRSPQFYQPIFNVFLTIPFGVYLSYMFKLGWKRTLLFAFLLTLSFESIQVSALFGIYPRPYRLFDVDDLMLNTLGGMIGFFLAQKFGFLLPDLNKLDEKVILKSINVSIVRRLTALAVDVTVLIILASFLPFQTLLNSFFAFCLIIAFPQISFKRTIGMRLVHIQISRIDGGKPKTMMIIVRLVFGFMLNFTLLFGLAHALTLTGTAPESQLSNILFVIIVLVVVLGVIAIDILLSVFTKHHQFWFGRLSQTMISSTFFQDKDVQSEKSGSNGAK